jgi:C4-dicarboxylate-specific signal transduction histidine kinase
MTAGNKLVHGWSVRDGNALSQIETVLERMGQSMDAVVAQTLRIKLDDIERIDRMLANAEARRHLVLREIDRHRAAIAARLRAAADEIEDASFTELPRPNGPDADAA